MFTVGLRQTYSADSLVIILVALSIGVLAFAADRSTNANNILLSKPLFRRDVVVGKFFGLTMFMFLLSFVTILADTVFLMIFFGGPNSIIEFIIRALSFVIVLSFECSLTIGITMLIGMVFKNLLAAVSVAVTYFFITWRAGYITQYFGDFYLINPFDLCTHILSVSLNICLFDTAVSYFDWLSAAAPFIVLILLEIMAVLALNCFVFMRQDD